MKFREWFLTEDTGRPGAKRGLYPDAYHQCDNYPPPDVMNWSADAITYMPPEQRKLKFIWGKGLLAKFDSFKGGRYTEIPDS